MNTSAQSNSIMLTGLDGANPLAFLAALGTLRTLTTMYPESGFRMNWEVVDGGWRPRLTSSNFEFEPSSLCDEMAGWLSSPVQLNLLEAIGDNLTLAPTEFRKLALNELQLACKDDSGSRSVLDYLAAFGSDATYQPHSKDRTLMQDTALRTMSGAGHQHFIKFMREIIANTCSTHLYSTLFFSWTYEDEGRGMNLRWDPIDDRRYAMRWKNPSSDPATTMRGANRLAIEAIPLFSTAPDGNQLRTTGFRTIPKQGTFFSWPIWEPQINLDAIQCLQQHPRITSLDDTTDLSDIGVHTVFRSQRITIGKFRNFTPAKPAL